MSYLWVGLGGAFGSILRFWISVLVAARFDEKFPVGTIVINITGSFVIGIFAALSKIGGPLPEQWRTAAIQLLMIGICGGYTTFSSFSLQSLYLAQEGRWDLVALNIGLSVVFCFVGVWLGYSLGTALSK